MYGAEEVTEADMEEASHAHDFIISLKDGYEHGVGSTVVRRWEEATNSNYEGTLVQKKKAEPT